jgi:hypothetical protein
MIKPFFESVAFEDLGLEVWVGFDRHAIANVVVQLANRVPWSPEV